MTNYESVSNFLPLCIISAVPKTTRKTSVFRFRLYLVRDLKLLGQENLS